MPLQNQNFPMIAIQCQPRYRLRSSVLALVITIWLPSSVSADHGNDTATRDWKKLLDVGWNASNERLTAQAQFRQAKNDAPGDVRVDFAMALVSLQNHNLEEASTHLADALQTEKSLLPIRRVQVWASSVAVIKHHHQGGDHEPGTRFKSNQFFDQP